MCKMAGIARATRVAGSRLMSTTASGAKTAPGAKLDLLRKGELGHGLRCSARPRCSARVRVQRENVGASRLPSAETVRTRPVAAWRLSPEGLERVKRSMQKFQVKARDWIHDEADGVAAPVQTRLRNLRWPDTHIRTRARARTHTHIH